MPDADPIAIPLLRYKILNPAGQPRKIIQASSMDVIDANTPDGWSAVEMAPGETVSLDPPPTGE